MLIQRLEEKYAERKTGEKEDGRKVERELARVVEENRRGLEELAGTKARLLQVEAGWGEERQQGKILRK